MDSENPIDGQSDIQPMTAADSPFDNIIDDTEERAEAREWIYREFFAGHDADEMLIELTGNGWPTQDAEAMVEEGRKATRHLRGAYTREDVARVAEARYRGSFSMIAARFGMGGMLLVGIHFLLSLRNSLRFPRRDHDELRKDQNNQI